MTYANFPWRAAFLNALRQVPVVSFACKSVGIDRSTAYKARTADEEFAALWDDALEDGVDRAEQEAFRRGVDGFEEPVVHQGQITPRMAPVVDEDGEPVLDELTKTQKWAPVLDAQGQPVPLTVRKYSDTLLSKVLTARRKAYRTQNTEVSGPDGAPLQIDETTRNARLAAILATAKERSDLV